jgi:UDP-glucose 4,6-dehydratase
MVLLLGSTGYIGQAFAAELRRRGTGFIPLTRQVFDYTRFEFLFDYMRKVKPRFVINAAGYAGNPSIDACEDARLETFQANVILPQMVARACSMTRTPWGHVSTGCIYSGAKIFENGQMRVEKDLNRPDVRRLYKAHPEKFFGFTELDEPNFSFRHVPSNFCSGTKVLAEEAIREYPEVYIWRPRIPFNERDEPRNLLSKLQRYRKILDTVQSLSHLEECVRACLDLWEYGAPYGIYNVTNPGAVTTRKVVEMIERIIQPDHGFEYWHGDREFYQDGSHAARSNCILDVSKLLNTGIRLRSVEEALEDSLQRWRPAAQPPRLVEERRDLQSKILAFW